MKCASVILLVALSSHSAWAGNLSNLLQSPRLRAARLGPAILDIGPALADTVASTYPLAAASTNAVYGFNEDTNSFAPVQDVGGAVFGERADTLGLNRFSVSVSYSYVQLSTINGDNLSALTNRRSVNGTFLLLRAKDPSVFQLTNGRFSNYAPVAVTLGLDVTAHIASPTFVYGVTPDLDLGITIPLVETELGADLRTALPDPRFPVFKFCRDAGCRNPPPRDHRAVRDTSVGLGDIVLRAKYSLLRSAFVDVAAGMDLALPTGQRRDFQGLGRTRVHPTLILSRLLGTWAQPYVNLGVDYDTQTVARSTARWAVGVNLQVMPALTGLVGVLGRHDLGRQARVPRPFFFQIHRTDYYDAALGLRYRFAPAGSVGANVLVPLSSGGLRAEAIPTVEVEYAF